MYVVANHMPDMQISSGDAYHWIVMCLVRLNITTKIVNINKVFVAIVMHTLKLLNHLVCLHTDD